MTHTDPSQLLTILFRAAVKAADPEQVTRQAVAELAELASPVWVIAIGKGANRMASGAVRALDERGSRVADGLVIANADDASAGHGLSTCLGDHPTPGANSFLAAQRLADLASHTTADGDALVLISGGTTSLIASPVEGLSHVALTEAFDALLASGAEINLMNAIRKRLLRFGAGRLALALGTRRVTCLIASDVVGNDLPSIGSGPCVADTSSAADVRLRAQKTPVWDSLPESVRTVLDDMADGRTPDVPAADHPRFRTTTARVILDRTYAERGAATAAEREGLPVTVREKPLEGEASIAGRRFASELLASRHKGSRCTIWTGETTVTLGESRAPGGRCQEFALAAAIGLEEAGKKGTGLTILAAGTDGRDGPTDAAGAIVDSTTCSRIREGGIDPSHALRTHDSHEALDTASALLRTGPTGTNVNDLVIGLLP